MTETGVVTISKNCLMGRLCGKNSFEDLNNIAQGVYVKDLYKNNLCLSAYKVSLVREVGSKNDARRKKVDAYLAKWVKCNTTMSNELWNIKILPKVTDEPGYILQLSPQGLPGEEKSCLAWNDDRRLYMHPCKKKVRNPLRILTTRFPFYDCSLYFTENIGSSKTVSDKFAIGLSLNPFYIKEKDISNEVEVLCRLKNSSISYGYLKENMGVPFQLPNEIITIKCIDTFGVNEMNFLEEYQITCKKDMKLLTCVKAPGKNIGNPSSEKFQSHESRNIFGFKAHLNDPFVFSTIFLGNFGFIMIMIGCIALYRNLYGIIITTESETGSEETLSQ